MTRRPPCIPPPVEIDTGCDAILFLGDIAWRGERPLAGIRDSSGLADSYAVPNLEGAVLGCDERKRMRLTRVVGLWNSRATLAWLDTFRGAAVSLANNHIDDYVGGMAETLGRLQERGVCWVGGGRDVIEAARPLRLHMAGGRTVLLAAATDDRISARLASLRRSGSHWLGREALFAYARALRRAYPGDEFALILHWGVELEALPSPEQRRVARGLLQLGVDVIVGHHPHVWQGWEAAAGGLCVYSLGNFLISEGDFADGRVAFPPAAHEGYGLLFKAGDPTLLRFRCRDLQAGEITLEGRYSWRAGEWSRVLPRLDGDVGAAYEASYRKGMRLAWWYPVWMGTETDTVRVAKRTQLYAADRLRWLVRGVGPRAARSLDRVFGPRVPGRTP